MTKQIMEDLRRIMLGLLYLIVFGWMAAQVMPGMNTASMVNVPPQLAAGNEIIPPAD